MFESADHGKSSWESLRKVAIAFALVMFAFAFASLATTALKSNPIHLASLCVGFVPFWWFARKVNQHGYDWYDYVALSTCLIAAGSLLPFLLAKNDLQSLRIPAVVSFTMLGFTLWRRLRSTKWKTSTASDE